LDKEQKKKKRSERAFLKEVEMENRRVGSQKKDVNDRLSSLSKPQINKQIHPPKKKESETIRLPKTVDDV